MIWNLLPPIMMFCGVIVLASCSDSNSPPDKSFAAESQISTDKAAMASSSIAGTKLEQRLKDLSDINAALERYKSANGNYPKTDGWAGAGNKWGLDTRDWVPGLAPDFISSLPVDVDYPASRYLYRSDGEEYKLIAHQTDDCEALRDYMSELVDPARTKEGRCWAYGYWSTGMAER